MQYITEMDLRRKYREEPFETYRLGSGVKLTPEAKQFLTDRRITIAADCKIAEMRSASTVDENGITCKEELTMLFYRIEAVEAEMLFAAEWFSGHEECSVAGEILSLCRIVYHARTACLQGKQPEAPTFWNCSLEELHGKVNTELFPFSLDSLPHTGDLRLKVLMLNRLRTEALTAILVVRQLRGANENDGLYTGLRDVLQTLADVLCIMMGKYIRGNL